MNIKIKADLREIGRKSVLKDYRKNGFIPAVIYKAGEKGTNILLPDLEFKKLYKKAIGEVAFYEIAVNGNEITTVLKEKQIDPVSREFVHLDFVELLEGQKITLDVPLKFMGTPLGVEEGGIIDIILRSIKVTCLPKNVPDNIEIDISNMNVGESIYFGDLDLENLETDISDDSAIVNVVAAMSEEEYEASLEASLEAEEEEIEALEDEVKEDKAEESEKSEDNSDEEKSEETDKE